MKYVYTPESYFKLFKMEYMQRYYQFEQDDNLEALALGGIYEIDFIEGEDKVHIIPGDFIVQRNELIPYEPEKYDFKVGDIVELKPICAKTENQNFEIGGYFKIGCSYKICRIINKFYMTLLNENNFEGNPIRFCDVVKVKK